MENKHIIEVTNNNRTYVVREWNDITPYVVHLYLGEDKYEDGDYCRTLEQAKKILLERAGLK